MKFYSSSYPIPEEYHADDYTFRPLSPSDVELDFDAVITSRELLNRWSQSDWPREGFTLEENLSDLTWHELQHLEKEAFTYTIMNPEESLCLGCIYINPLRQEMVNKGVCESPGKDSESLAAWVAYWVRQSHATREFTARILESICQWLDRDWYFDCAVFLASPVDPNQAELFVEMGFADVGELTVEAWNSHWELYRYLPAREWNTS